MSETLILSRHGETAWNKEQRLQGSQDIPLSKKGIKQAEFLAKKLTTLKIDTIITSKLQRASQTAEIVGKKLGIRIEKKHGFNERSYGQFEGRIWSEVKKELAVSGLILDSFAEPFADFSARVLATLNNLLTRHLNQKILIICHGGVLRVLLEHLRKTPSPSGNIGYELPNTAIYLFTKDKSQWIEK